MIKFLHLLSVIVFCTVQLIEGSIYDELKHYYNSDTNVEYNEEWKIFRKGFENEIAANLRENFGSTAVNIYEPGKLDAHLLARGFELTDGVVTVYFYEMVLRELPQLLRPKLEMDLPNNFLKLESRLGRMFIDTTYYVARNSSSIVYARPEDQKFLSPFSLQQVDTIGKLVIVAEDCFLSGIGISTLSGDSVNLGHSPFRITDCKLMVEISTPNSGAPPVISPYFSPGPKELLEMILSRPVREELETKLQGALYSYINMSVIFEQPTVYRTNQQKLFKSYFGFMTDYVADLNRNTIKQNKAHVKLPDYEVTMNTETAQNKLRCHVALTDVVLYGLDTAYVTRAGGPHNDGSTQTAADAIIFSSMQIRGKITHTDANGTSTKEFASELTDVTVILVILIEEDKPKLLQIHFTGWRSLEFSIIPRETSVQDRHDHQSLVYGYILNELPVRVLNHVTSIIGHAPVDGNKEDNGGASGDNGGGDGSGGDNGGESDNGGGDDNGGDNGGEEYKNTNGENDNSASTKSDNKAKGFFSDDVLDDNFFSDDGLDKNFFDDDLDKNFFNNSKETAPNEGEFKDIDDGNDKKEDNMDGDDRNEEYNEKQGDDENTAAGGDVDISNAPDGEQTNGDAGDPVEDENVAADDGDPENTNLEPVNEGENNPAGDNKKPVDVKFIDKNLESDFFSDDFIKTDFFSDDDFERKEQGDGTANNKKDEDQIDNDDNGNDMPDDNGTQVEKDDTNIDGNYQDDVEGNEGDDTEDRIDNADNNADDVPGDNTSNGEQVNQDNNDIDGNYEDDEKYDSRNENHPIGSDEVPRRPAPNGASDDSKPFFSDDVLDKDFFSDENVNGDKKTLQGDKEMDFATIEDTEDDKKTLNHGNKKKPKGEVEMDFATIEDTEDDNGKKKTLKGEVEMDFATIEDTEDDNGNKKTPKGEVEMDFATIEDTEDDKKTLNNGKKKTLKGEVEMDFATIEDTEDDKKTLNNGKKKTLKGEVEMDFATIEDAENDKKTLNNNKLNRPKPFFSEDDKPFFSDDVLDKDFFSDENVNGDKKTLKGDLEMDFATIEDTENDKKTPNNGKKKTVKGEVEMDFATIEDTENDKKTLNNGKKKTLKGEVEMDFATIEDTEDDKKTLNNKQNKGKKKMKAFANYKNKKDVKLSGGGFFSDMDFELDSAEGSRRHISQGNNTANERNPKNRDGDHSDVDQKRENLTIHIEEKHTSKENVTGNVENSREGKKTDLLSNVHNTRRRQNVHTSDNEIR